MNVGIIGGADGPTAALVSGSLAGLILVLLAAAAVIGAAVRLFRRKRKK